MKSKDLLFCSTVLILVFGFADLASAATYYCNSCSDCESKINSALAGDSVRLTADIINQNGTCINWGSSNVDFDCQGHLIDKDNSSGYGMRGIHVEGKGNNTIKNCKITDFNDNGIFLYFSDNNRVISNTISFIIGNYLAVVS